MEMLVFMFDVRLFTARLIDAGCLDRLTFISYSYNRNAFFVSVILFRCLKRLLENILGAHFMYYATRVHSS